MFQALYAPTEGAGTFVADVKVDDEACASLLSPINTTDISSQQFNATNVLLPPLELVNGSPQWASELQISVATVALDAYGNALPDTFYPYYGSTTRKLVLPTAPSTFQSEFRPKEATGAQ
jgi:hypothetical protein